MIREEGKKICCLPALTSVSFGVLRFASSWRRCEIRGGWFWFRRSLLLFSLYCDNIRYIQDQICCRLGSGVIM